MEKFETITSLKKWKSIEIMLALLFLVAPFYFQFNLGGEGFRIPSNITVWLVAYIVGCYSMYQFAMNGKITIPRYFTYIAAFPVLVLLSGFITGVAEPMEWLFRLLFIWLGLLFFLALFQYDIKQGRVDRILFIIVLSALFQALIGIWQITYPELLIKGMPNPRSVMPYGIFQQINNQATYQVTAIVISIFLLTRPYISKGAPWKTVAILLFLALGAYVVSLSGSRIGMLTAILALPLTIVSRWKYLVKNKQLTILAVFFLMAGIIAGNSGFAKAADKTIAINSGMSANARLGIYTIAIDLIKAKPVFGYGLGRFESVWHYQKGEFHTQNPDITLVKDYVTHPHNEFFLWLIEGGIVAVAGLFWFLMAILLSINGDNKHRKGVYLAMLLPIGLHTQVELPFYTSAIHWFLGLFLVFVIMKTNCIVKTSMLSAVALSTIKLLSIVMFVVGTIFFAHTLRANYELGYLDIEKDVWDLSTAKDNPYFRNFVISMQMKSVLLTSRDNNTTEGIEEFIAWAEEYVHREPSAQMFTYLALAYQKLGQKDEMCRAIKKGENIHPRNQGLKDGVMHCST